MTSGRFDPAQHALILTGDGDLEKPLSEQERRAFEKGLVEVTKARTEEKPSREEASWHHLLAGAELKLDGQGRPILQVRSGEGVITVGITRDNVLASEAPPEVVQELLVARIREQLKGGRAPKTSDRELRQDWKLLKTAFATGAEGAAARNRIADADVAGSMD
jgi:hypothetical protein